MIVINRAAHLKPEEGNGKCRRMALMAAPVGQSVWFSGWFVARATATAAASVNATNTKHAVPLTSPETNKTTFRADNEANKVRMRMRMRIKGRLGGGVAVGCGCCLIYQAVESWRCIARISRTAYCQGDAISHTELGTWIAELGACCLV